jgi:hypothetical protein
MLCFVYIAPPKQTHTMLSTTSLQKQTPSSNIRKTIILHFITLMVCLLEAVGQSYDQQAGSGFGNLHFGVDGSLGQVFTPVTDDHVSELLFRRYTAADGWGANEVVASSNNTGSPESGSDAAVFHLNRGDGNAWEVICLNTYAIEHYTRSQSGTWLLSGSKGVSSNSDWGKKQMISVSVDSQNVYHIAYLEGGSSPDLNYLRYDGNNWTEKVIHSFTSATTLSGFDSPHQFRSPRMLSIGISDSPKIRYPFGFNER